MLLGGVQRGIFGNPIGVQLKLDPFRHTQPPNL
jgi:hypothetical protein